MLAESGGADGGELVFVAQQDDAAAVGHGAQQIEHEGEVEHGGFVDDEDVERQGVLRVKLRAHLRRTQFEQAVDGLAFELGQMGFEAVCQRETLQGGVQGAPHVGGGFAGGGGQGGARQGGCAVAQQGEEFGDGGGFAGARAAANQDEVLQQGERGGGLLACAAGFGKPVLQVARRCGGVGGGGGAGGKAADFVRQVVFELPHSAEKQPPSGNRQRRVAAAVGQRGGGGEGGGFVAGEPDEAVAVGEGGKQARQEGGAGFGSSGMEAAEEFERGIGGGVGKFVGHGVGWVGREEADYSKRRMGRDGAGGRLKIVFGDFGCAFRRPFIEAGQTACVAAPHILPVRQEAV